MAGRLQFDFQLGEPQVQPAAEIDSDRPMRILVLGDFSGRPQADRGPLSSRALPRVDLDNFEEVLERLTPRLEVTTDGDSGALALEFRSLDDFHPDRVYARVGLFSELAQLRSRLGNPATFAEAAAEFKSEHTPRSVAPPVKEAPPAAVPEDGAALLDQILGSQPSAERAVPASSPVQEMIQGIVAPHIVSSPGPEQERFVAAVDEAISSRMRAILHDPRVQRLEALWRGVEKLVIAAGDEVRVHLLDVTRNELAEDIERAGERLQGSDLYRLLAERGVGTPGGEPWSLMVGNLTFGTSERDVRLLGSLGAIASQAGGPFLAAADPQILGCRSLVETRDPRDWQDADAEAEERWNALRRSPVAASIGLALPRVLVRLPYGPETDAIESFRFVELTGPANEHQRYLWGNPALTCARLLARSFVEQGWSMQPRENLDLEGLPAHTYRNEYGEPELKPSAEVVLTESAAEAILERGLMPVLSYRGRDAARLARFQSIADPPAPLRGAWE